MTDDVDFEAEGLLEGLEDRDEREARLALLKQLHDEGVSLDELRTAVSEERLALLPVERALSLGQATYTLSDVAEKVGLDVDTLLQQRAALGLPVPEPDIVVATDADVEAAQRTKQLLDMGISRDQALGVIRVIGRATADVAGAVQAMFNEELVRPGDTERDMGLRYAAAAKALTPTLVEGMGYAVVQHLLENTRQDVVRAAELRSGNLGRESRDAAVAFADLVGFTRLGAQVDAGELGGVAGRLAELAATVAKPPVRLVKTIGDAAMLAAPEPAPLLDATLELVDLADAEGDDFPQLRAGVATGPVLVRSGDIYGHTVNLASRITGVARPGSVLVEQAVRDALETQYRWSFAGARRLKGIPEAVALHRARAVEEE
jgi:adenylate cyclase